MGLPVAALFFLYQKSIKKSSQLYLKFSTSRHKIIKSWERGRSMRAAVLGAGLMGKKAARYLVNDKHVEEVGLADIDLERAEGACRQINSPKIKAFQLDAGNLQELVRFRMLLSCMCLS